MPRVSNSEVRTTQIACLGLTLAAAFFLFAGCVAAQAQQGGSLADTARQIRAQKAQTGTDGSQAQQIAAELSEDQNDTGAPGGFKTYNAGDYQLWVPAPYRVEGHDDAGIVLSGPMVGVKHSIVMIGTPIAVHWQNNDDAFADTAAKFSRLYAQTSACTKTTIANHPAYQCSLAAANLLGTHVSGNAIFVMGSGNIYPVFCTSPSDSQARDFLNDPHSFGLKDWSQKALAREDDDSRGVFQKCEKVFQSIHLKAEGAQPQVAQTKAARDVSPTSTAASGASSIADPAPRTVQGPTQAVQTAPTSVSEPAASTVPAGFKIHAFNYCKGHNECWNASVLVPSDAKLISSSCKQYVFESKVQGTSFVLMAGPAVPDCDGNGGGGPDPVRWNQLVDPENKRAPGTYSVISTLNANLDGKPAVITTMGLRKGMDSWMGKRAELENNGVPLVVGCMAPRDHFADGDAICSRLIESLLLP